MIGDVAVRCDDCGTQLGELERAAPGEWLCRRCFLKRPGPTVSDDEMAEIRAASEPRTIDGVEPVRRALLINPTDLKAAMLNDLPPREAVPGSRDLLHRGLSALFFGERSAGKSMVTKILMPSMAAAGERVLYLDRENGAQATAAHMLDIFDAHPEWADVVASGQLVGKHYPALDGKWKGVEVAAALDGFTVVVLDSVREMVGQLGGSNNDDDSITALYNVMVTPLLIKRVAVLLLDNVGHEHTHRPKGAGGKGDATPQVYKVTTDEKFGPEKLGKVTLTCTRSRFGDEQREWTVRIGNGVFDLPMTTSEAPDAQAVHRLLRRREDLRRGAVAALTDEQPLGRDKLIASARERGVKGRTETLRNDLAYLAADPASGLGATPDGYALLSDVGATPDEKISFPASNTLAPDPLAPAAPFRGTGRGAIAEGDGERVVEDDISETKTADPWPDLAPDLMAELKTSLAAQRNGHEEE